MRAALTPKMWLVVAGLIMTVVVASVTAPLIETGRLLLFIVYAGGLALCGLIFLATWALTPSLLLTRIVMLGFMLQMFWMLLIALVGARTFLPNNPIAPDAADYPLEGVVALLLVPFVAFGACLLVSLLLRKQRTRPSIRYQLGI